MPTNRSERVRRLGSIVSERPNRQDRHATYQDQPAISDHDGRSRRELGADLLAVCARQGGNRGVGGAAASAGRTRDRSAGGHADLRDAEKRTLPDIRGDQVRIASSKQQVATMSMLRSCGA